MIKYGIDNSEIKESSLKEDDLKKRKDEAARHEEKRSPKKIEWPPFLDRGKNSN